MRYTNTFNARFFTIEMAEPEEVYITHYFSYSGRDHGENIHALTFLSTNQKGLEKNFYFQGHDFARPIMESELILDLKSGALVELPFPVKSDKNDSLWIDRVGMVYVANKDMPNSDPMRRAVYDSRTKTSLI